MMLFAVFIIPFEYGISLFKGINLLSHLLFKQQPRLLKSPFWNSMIPGKLESMKNNYFRIIYCCI